MIIGLKARFSDLEGVLSLQPELVEFQFSDKDPDFDFRPKEKYNIPCIIHLPEMWGSHLIDVASISNENQVLPLDESVRVIQEIVTKSERFFQYFTNEKNYFILHPGGMTFEKDNPDNNKYRVETLIKSLETIKTNNSEILVENLPPYPWYFGGQWNSNFFMDAEEIESFCKITKRNVCYDSSHSKLYCNVAEKDFFQQYITLKPYISHIQVADAVGVDGEGIQIDEGEIDFQRFFQETKGYQGAVVNEVWKGFLNDFAGFKIAVERIKKHISAIK